MIEAKTFRTFIRIYSLFRSERLSANIILALHKALIRSIITYSYLSWELVANTYVLKLQRLRNYRFSALSVIFQGARRSAMHTAFNLPSVYDYITKLCSQQAEIIQNHENGHVRSIGQGEARHRKYCIIGLNLVMVKFTVVQVTKLPF
jgi:hypothetical protein